MKALDHAIEGLLNSPSIPVVSPLAIEGIRVLAGGLCESVSTVAARTAVQLAAWQCYYAPAAVRYGPSHRIGHALGGTFGLNHSATSAVTRAPVVRELGDARPEVTVLIAEALGAGGVTSAAADRLALLTAELGLPMSLRALGLPNIDHLADIERLVRTHYPETIMMFDTAGPAAFTSWLATLW
jgi:maleylacetate reductase